MSRGNECTARLCADGRTFILTRGSWSNTYPVGEIGRWLDFYERLRREHPKSKSAYDRTIEALSELGEEIARRSRR